MRHAFGYRGALLLAAAGATLGCIRSVEYALLVNETAAPLQVRYSVPFVNVDVGTTPICPLFGDPPEVRPNTDDLRSPNGWLPASNLEVDGEKCEASFVLEPGLVSRLFRNGFCDDYEEHADQGEAFHPNFEYLIIKSRSGTREWREWEAVAQFRRASSGSCFLRFRE
jgi:hypothetical protein